MFVHLGLVDITFYIMRKTFSSLTLLSLCSLSAYASDTASNTVSYLLVFLAPVALIAFWVFIIWGIYLFFKGKKHEAKTKFKFSLYSIIVYIPLLMALLFVINSSNLPNENSEVSNKEKIAVEKNSSSQIKKGYSFILSRVKSPSNTSLQASKYSKEVKNMVEEHCHIKLPACITVGYFSVDTPNDYGTQIREGFWVFYRDENPCHLETDTALDKIAATQNGHLLISALEMNGCGCN